MGISSGSGLDQLGDYSAIVMVVFVVIVLWTMAWKGIALWRAGVNRQKIWYILLFFLSTAGVLEILYLAFFQKEKK